MSHAIYFNLFYTKNNISFRIILQLRHQLTVTFNVFPKNMDRIRLYSIQIPDQVKKVVRTLIKGTDEDIKDILPIELGKIERNSSECLSLAEAVEKKFQFVMELTNELNEVSSAAQGHYQKEKEETEKKREIALIKEKKVREAAANMKEQQEKLENQVREAKRDFERAMDSMPSGMELVGMHVVETITNLISGSSSAVLGKSGNPSSDPNSQEDSSGTEQMYTVSLGGDQLKQLIIQLVEHLTSGTPGKDPSGTGETLSRKLQWMRLWMESLNKDFSAKEDSAFGKKLAELLSKGLEICKKAEELSSEISSQPKDMEAVAKEASVLKEKVCKFCTKIKANSGGNPLYTKPPRQVKTTASAANSASSGLTNAVVENARFKVAEARGLLEKQEERYDKASQEMKESNKKLGEVLQELAEFSPEKIADFEEIRKTLRLGLQALASLREKWQKLVEFFQFVTSIIKACQNESIASFVQYAKVGQKRALTNGYAGTDFMRDVIYEQVNQANTTSYVVWSISNMYVEISRNHLMGRLASLSQLIALDPEKDRHKIEMMKNELLEGSKQAQEEIKRLVWEAQDQYHDKVEKRIKQIESELMKVLPPEDPSRIKEIEVTVKEAIKEADDEHELNEEKFA